MAKVRYVGIHDCVIVPLPLGGETVVERDGVLNTSDAHAQGLLEQVANWEPANEIKSGGKDVR